MTSTALDRLATPSCPIPNCSSVPQVETPVHPGPDDPGGSALVIVEAIIAFVRGWRERQRDRYRLAEMSARELQDIGACRSEIDNEIGKPFWRP